MNEGTIAQSPKSVISGKCCSVDGCNEKILSKGFCRKHYMAFWKYGDPLIVKKVPNGTTMKWIRDHLDYSEDGCLFWPFGIRGSGYGSGTFEGKSLDAHVIVCTLVHGPKPFEDAIVCHSCGKGMDACVHPLHVRWGTYLDNAKDKFIHGTTVIGEASVMAKLTESDVRRIRVLSGSMTNTDLGKMFGVSRTAIYLVLKGKNWHHTK